MCLVYSIVISVILFIIVAATIANAWDKAGNKRLEKEREFYNLKQEVRNLGYGHSSHASRLFALEANLASKTPKKKGPKKK